MANEKDLTYLTFPCEFPIKIMGKADLGFQALALEIIRKHAPNLSEGAIETRYSKDKNYISLTVTINATSKAQLDAIYKELHEHEKVMIVL